MMSPKGFDWMKEARIALAFIYENPSARLDVEYASMKWRIPGITVVWGKTSRALALDDNPDREMAYVWTETEQGVLWAKLVLNGSEISPN
jgi:hypothetical protein